MQTPELKAHSQSLLPCYTGAARDAACLIEKRCVHRFVLAHHKRCHYDSASCARLRQEWSGRSPRAAKARRTFQDLSHRSAVIPGADHILNARDALLSRYSTANPRLEVQKVGRAEEIIFASAEIRAQFIFDMFLLQVFGSQHR